MIYVVEIVDTLFGPFVNASQAAKWASAKFGYTKWRVAPVSKPEPPMPPLRARLLARRKRK